MRQDNVEPHRRCAHFMRAAISGFHDARPATRADKQLLGHGQWLTVRRYQPCKKPSLVIQLSIATMALRKLQGCSIATCVCVIQRLRCLLRRWKARTAVHHHGIFNALLLLCQVGFEHFQLKADAAGFTPE